ncbi:MAG TPA: DUF3500 domain-containing protein [Pirellulaceae bacterium]|nr:DUF3500 domain-containing protein [Pirellulaceae bacterium]
MSTRRLIAPLLALTVVLSATAAWSYYRLAVTGETMGEAATKFLAALSAEQRAKAALPYDDARRSAWHFIPLEGAKEREGLKVREMSPEQRTAAFALLKSALSEVGYGKATKIMELESLLLELQKPKAAPIRDSERYYFVVYGAPTSEGRWGLSIEGHHLSLNFVVDKGKVISSTPTAFCANPAIVMNENVPSIKKGTRLLAKEETLAFELLASLSPEQKKVAVIADKALGEVRSAGEPQPPTDAPAGLAAEKLTGQQRGILQSLLDAYCENLPADVVKERREAIEKQGLGQVHFAWAGAQQPGVGHYYRVQGPTFLIEFVNTQPDSAGNPANHIHSMWRDMQGDFALPIK